MCIRDRGLTSVQDAGLDVWEIQNIKALDEAKKLEMRMYVMVNAGEKNYNYFRENGGIFTHHLRVQSFKYYADGALGSRGASVSYTHLRAHETVLDLVCRLLLEKKKNHNITLKYIVLIAS